MGTSERLQSVKAALQRATCPCVMVIASPAVEAACTQRNGLALAELLRPFGVIRQLNGSVGGGTGAPRVERDAAEALRPTLLLPSHSCRRCRRRCLPALLLRSAYAHGPYAGQPLVAFAPAVPVRTPAEHPLRLHSWRLRFYTSDTMFQPAPEAADAYLRDEVLGAAATEAAVSEVPDVQELLAAAGGWCREPCSRPGLWGGRRERSRHAGHEGRAAAPTLSYPGAHSVLRDNSMQLLLTCLTFRLSRIGCFCCQAGEASPARRPGLAPTVASSCA